MRIPKRVWFCVFAFRKLSISFKSSKLDPKFQTSFIPKQPVSTGETYRTSGGVNLVVLLSFIVLIVAGVSAAGLYFYQKSIVASIEEINVKLGKIREDLQPALIAEIKRTDNRIELAKKILERHNATSVFFLLLGDRTLKGVSFKSFDYKEGDAGTISVNLSGEATSYGAVAVQADELFKGKGIVNPVFSDFSLNQFGRVLFSAKFDIKPEEFLYVGTINASPTSETQNVESQIVQ